MLLLCLAFVVRLTGWGINRDDWCVERFVSRAGQMFGLLLAKESVEVLFDLRGELRLRPGPLPSHEFINTRQVRGMIDRLPVGVVEWKTLLGFGIGGEMFGKNLNSDIAAEASIAGAIDFSHAACANRRLNFVGTEFGAGG